VPGRLQLDLLSALLFAACGASPPRQPTPADQTRPEAPSPAPGPTFDARGLSFTVSTADGRTRFRRGERIVLRLAFASNRPQTYRLDAGTYDRGGRMQVDQYRWEPRAGAVDPLAEWFAHGFELGGLRTMPLLSTEPEVVERDLGEYLRFDAPGRYALTVTTGRVESDDGPVPLTAAPLAIEILPADEAWASATIAEARRALEATGSTSAPRTAAARVLRFLGTPEATRVMAERLVAADAGEATFDLMMGVAGAPDRARAKALLTEALTAPDAPVDGTVLELLAFFTLVRAPAAGGTWLTERRRVLDDLAARLAAAFPNKRGPRARTVTFATLLELGFSNGASPPPWLAALTSRLPEMLPLLPLEAQERLLAHRWRHVRSAALAPSLATLVNDGATAPSLRAHALHRLVELDPAGGRARVAAEIRRVPLRLGPEWRVALTALPRGPIAGLDDDLARGVERRDHELDVRAELAARYGSPAIRARLEAVLDDRPGELSSEALGSILGFVARLDERAAARRIEAGLAVPPTHVRFALAAPRALVEAPSAAPVEDVVIELLADPDPVLAVAAAETLVDAGSARARPALAARLAEWRAAWRPRARELVSTVTEVSPHADQVRLEVALGRALVSGRSWILPADEVARLRDDAVTDGSRQDLGVAATSAAATSGSPTIAVRFAEDGGLDLRLGAVELDSFEALRARATLYPRGTRFRVEVAEGATEAEVASLRRGLRGVATVPF